MRVERVVSTKIAELCPIPQVSFVGRFPLLVPTVHVADCEARGIVKGQVGKVQSEVSGLDLFGCFSVLGHDAGAKGHLYCWEFESVEKFRWRSKI